MTRRLFCFIGAAAFAMSATAGGPATASADFTGAEVPPGWTVDGGTYRSPIYESAVDRIELRYSGADAASSATVHARSAQDEETTVATFTAASSSASFDFPDTTDFRSIRIATANGLELSSFTAYVSADSIEAPSGVLVTNNITGTSFDVSWNAVEGSVGYKVYLWTNVVVGASAGSEVWRETMPGATNLESTSKLTDEKFNNCFENGGWTRSDKAGYPTGVDGTIRIGTSSDNGWIQTPSIDSAADGMVVRFWAKANATNTKSMDITVECVTGDVAVPVGTATLTTEMQEFTVALPDWTSGDCIRFNSVTSGDRRTIIGAVAVASGYSEGHIEPSYVLDGIDVGNATKRSFTDLPSVPMSFAVAAYGKRGVVSASTDPVVVDLSNPDKVAMLNACPISALDRMEYSQNFDSLATVASTDWLNGTTLPYWQAYRKSNPATKISHNSGSASSGGLYALASDVQSGVRALGGLSTQSDAMSWGVAFTNDTSETVRLCAVGYSAQQWGTRNEVPHNLTLSYLVSGELKWMSDETDGWVECASTAARTDKPAMPVSTAVAYAPEPGIAVGPGQIIYLKWTSKSPSSGSAAMMGIDDLEVSFSAPTSFSVHIVQSGR